MGEGTDGQPTRQGWRLGWQRHLNLLLLVRRDRRAPFHPETKREERCKFHTVRLCSVQCDGDSRLQIEYDRRPRTIESVHSNEGGGGGGGARF